MLDQHDGSIHVGTAPCILSPWRRLLRCPPPFPMLCLGMLWRAELAGCAQRDSAKPTKQSGVRLCERDRDGADCREPGRLR